MSGYTGRRRRTAVSASAHVEEPARAAEHRRQATAGVHARPLLACVLLLVPHVPRDEVVRYSLGGRRGRRCEGVELRHVGLHAIDGRAGDAEIFRDRPVAVALDEQERHAPDAVLAVDESFPGTRPGLRRAREREVGWVDVECLPGNRARLVAAQDRQVADVGEVEVGVEHEYRMPVRGGERVDSRGESGSELGVRSQPFAELIPVA